MRSPLLNTLLDMLRYCRPHGSQTENTFRAKYLLNLPGISQDAYGNLHLTIGNSPILWSCHTDTVHRSPGMQTIHYDHVGQTIQLSRRAKLTSNCLGADDTVGVFIMREMVLARVPGHYVFHYGEEAGCIGSSDLAHEEPSLLVDAKYAIALDRAGTSDIVTHQIGDRCTSDLFVSSFARALSLASVGVLEFTGAHGVYTDTAEYMDHIHECSNLSVGYYQQHSPKEWIDVAHVDRLLSALLVLDQSSLASGDYARTPKRVWISPSSVSFRDYEAPTATDNHIDWRNVGLWRHDWRAEYDWCDDCEAPVIPDNDPNSLDVDSCRCIHNTEDELSEEDWKFLHYLKGLN